MSGSVNSLSAEELCRYNAADVRRTHRAWQAIQGDIAQEAAVYAHDRELARMCHEMSFVGIGVDEERRRYLSDALRKRRFYFREKMRTACGESDFAPGRLNEVRRVLFSRLGGTYTALTSSGLPSTANTTLEALRGNDTPLARFAGALLQWRLVGKIKSTYVDGIPGVRGRAYYNWKAFGTVSGRLACRLQSCPKWFAPTWGETKGGKMGKPQAPDWKAGNIEDRVREVYVPREGHRFVYFDVSQAEMRLAAWASADPVFMRTCAGDVHCNNAALVWPTLAEKGYFTKEKKDVEGKKYRDIAKNFGFAISYGAGADKLYATLHAKGMGEGISVSYCAKILSDLRSAYRVYYAWAEQNLFRARREGFMRTLLLGRIRWFGWAPDPQDIYNYPIQSALADVVNVRVLEAERRLSREVRLVAQIHDACIYETPEHLVDDTKARIAELWEEPVRGLAGGDLVLPIDLKDGMRWSAL